MAELLFVMKNEGPFDKKPPNVGFVTLDSPDGPVFMAFTSRNVVKLLAALYGVAAGVFVLPESELTPLVVGSHREHRVVLLHTPQDYNGATRNDADFPWPDRVILYDFEAALRRTSPS